MKRRSSLHAVILAGGAGERFWPRSRSAFPKPLLRVFGNETLLSSTVRRACRFTDIDRVWLVCGEAHAQAMRRDVGLPRRRILVEPRRLNTAMAVGLAAQRLLVDDPEVLMAVIPADHYVPDVEAFANAVLRAATAGQEGFLLTLGIRPTRPETGYGYIRIGKAVGRFNPGIKSVTRFVEKPKASQARYYLRNRRYLWNSGIFVWRADAILREIQNHAPTVYRALSPLRTWSECPRRTLKGLSAAIDHAYRRAPSLPIDKAVLEKSRKVWCLPVNFPWNDVGTWGALASELGVRENKTQVIDGEAQLHDSQGNLIWAGTRPVVLLGVNGLAVVDTDDAILIVRLERSSEVKEIVSRLRERGRHDLI